MLDCVTVGVVFSLAVIESAFELCVVISDIVEGAAVSEEVGSCG